MMTLNIFIKNNPNFYIVLFILAFFAKTMNVYSENSFRKHWTALLATTVLYLVTETWKQKRA